MQIEAQLNLEPALLKGATAIMVRTNGGIPLFLAIEHSPDHFTVKHAGEEGFQELVKELGLERVNYQRVVVEGPHL